MTKKLFVKTYGCQMNVYDSARMADVLAPIGYAPTDVLEDADMVLINTCHIREKAAEKVYSELGRIRVIQGERRAAGSDTIVAVAGCVAQAEGAELQRRAPVVDIVLGPQTYHRLPEMVARAVRARAKGERAGVLDTDFPVEPKFDHLPETAAPQGLTAFLTVQEGCDKFCTFCVVPYTRGAEFSRPAAAVLAEARRLVAQGTREITLLGQNVNAYHGEGPDGGVWGLGRLIRELAGIDGLARIRFTTSHPNDMDADLIAAFAEVPALMPYLHLPVQSGADRILNAMNRKHTGASYREVIAKLRDARPDLALSSDFIVGFPGESEKDFEATLDLVRDVRFASAFSFKYSPRPGTPASGMKVQVPEEAKADRLARLNALLIEQQDDFNRSIVGRTVPVLVDHAGRKPGQLMGRSPYLQPVQLDGDESLIGQVVPVAITGAGTFGLRGERCADADIGERARP